MRTKIIAANWKMNLTLPEGRALVQQIMDGRPGLDDNKIVVIAPPFTHLTQTAGHIGNVPYMYLGAQNCHSEASGAFTGEISAAMLQSAGVHYVIIGHSERRAYFQEDSPLLAKKINQTLAAGLKVIFCCGEPLEIRDEEQQNEHVEHQLREALFHLSVSSFAHIVVAYEPIWAIGTGRNATAAQAQDMHAHIRKVLASQYGPEAAESCSILYGGSCKPSNAAELFACPDVDGGLIGGASLNAQDFLAIIAAR
jgi:triosephosphate isomerase (TIM)